MDFYIGSGAIGRSYATSHDGFLFQAPVSYYSRTGRWALSPGYQDDAHADLTRPITKDCLECHASAVRHITGTVNRYEDPPFVESGVSCERCHGPGREHALKRAPTINPAKLEGRQRDSICAQCHLTGAARIFKPGRSLSDFRPGMLLSEVVVSFVEASGTGAIRATSHFENLSQSRCKQASAERMWCGTCHNPHAVTDFRARCLGCHGRQPCKLDLEKRRVKNDDCVACHMPKEPPLDVRHAVYTDHSIPRRPRNATPTSQRKAELVPFWRDAASPRDLALAYLDGRGAPDYDSAFRLLRSVESDLGFDPPALARLAFLYDRDGEMEKVLGLYKEALKQDPAQVDAAVNLGGYLAKRGQTREAIALWEDALSRNPGLDAARLNLALLHRSTNNRAAAEKALREALAINPDHPLARKLLRELTPSR
jgi:hypothetical protein